MTVTAWYMDEENEVDQRQSHRKNNSPDVTLDQLAELGVLHWTGLEGTEDPRLKQIRETRGYTYFDIINVHPDKLPDFEKKILSFFREHIHYDEEIRYCLDGSGYFDVRDENDQWIRISIQKGDMIILPEGMYHRFTCDDTNFIQAMRLFVGEPVWTPYNRDEIEEQTNQSRLKYIEKFSEPLRLKSKTIESDVKNLENNTEDESVTEQETKRPKK